MDFTTLILIMVGFLLITTLMQRPLKKQAQQQAAMRDTLAEGDRIMLTSGLFGTVTHVGAEQLVVELAPGMEVTVLKAAVNKVVGAEEEEFEFSDGASPEAGAPLAPATVGGAAVGGSTIAPAPEQAFARPADEAASQPAAPERVAGTGSDDDSGDADAMRSTTGEQGLGYPGTPGQGN